MVFMLIRNMNKSAITLLVLVKHNQLYLFPVLSFLFQHPTPRGCYNFGGTARIATLGDV